MGHSTRDGGSIYSPPKDIDSQTSNRLHFKTNDKFHINPIYWHASSLKLFAG